MAHDNSELVNFIDQVEVKSINSFFEESDNSSNSNCSAISNKINKSNMENKINGGHLNKLKKQLTKRLKVFKEYNKNKLKKR